MHTQQCSLIPHESVSLSKYQIHSDRLPTTTTRLRPSRSIQCAPWLTSLLPRRTVKACLRLLTPWFDEACYDLHQEPYCWGPYCLDSCMWQMHSIFWEIEMPYWEKVIKRNRDNRIIINSSWSDPVTMNSSCSDHSGVPLGSVHGPLLFQSLFHLHVFVKLYTCIMKWLSSVLMMLNLTSLSLPQILLWLKLVCLSSLLVLLQWPRDHSDVSEAVLIYNSPVCTIFLFRLIYWPLGTKIPSQAANFKTLGITYSLLTLTA